MSDDRKKIIDEGATIDMSQCERLIVIIAHAWKLHQDGLLPERNDEVRWDQIDKLKPRCTMLPGNFKEQLAIIESYRA